MLREFALALIVMLLTIVWIGLLREAVESFDVFQLYSQQKEIVVIICYNLLSKLFCITSDKLKYVVSVKDGTDVYVNATCAAIQKRAFYPTRPLSIAEQNFPISFIRIVYKDFHLQELMLNLMYAPQNLYCYALDVKSTPLFHEQMKNLSACFPNVFLTQQEYAVDSAGHNTSRSFLECLKLIRQFSHWKYAILLQNNDIPLKTNREMVEILTALNGSNDINVGYPNVDRVPSDAPWTFRTLQLFNDNIENDERILRLAKGSTSISLSYAFVQFIVDKLNLTILLDKLDSLRYGGDEMLFPSLHSEDSLDAPGGFTRKCIDAYNNMITRYVIWMTSAKQCNSNYYRHKICILGIADLPTIAASRALFANKMLPEFDYSVIGCWANNLYNRTYANSKLASIKVNDYANRLPVRFHKQRIQWRSNLTTFNCF
ncbi:unnamed protein product [Thelazia callipaeda]|uniref:Core-2/I-Branching enzyme n=1 Tax=Thelazia callipaeda TaxID=103827 RepID=A0A0N5DBK8_THECL|nr:unnamed protein product [Thelazia callipaeda]